MVDPSLELVKDILLMDNSSYQCQQDQVYDPSGLGNVYTGWEFKNTGCGELINTLTNVNLYDAGTLYNNILILWSRDIVLILHWSMHFLLRDNRLNCQISSL